MLLKNVYLHYDIRVSHVNNYVNTNPWQCNVLFEYDPKFFEWWNLNDYKYICWQNTIEIERKHFEIDVNFNNITNGIRVSWKSWKYVKP